MNRSIGRRIAAVVAGPALAAGILVGGAALATPHAHYLADFGANETAEIGQEHARDAGVRHEHDNGHQDNAAAAVPGASDLGSAPFTTE